MNAVSGSEPPSGLSPEEAFAVLGNETRATILHTLWDAREPFGAGTLQYSELFERSDFDSSANFAYHLNELTDHFVRKTEDGYAITKTGLMVARAVIAGTVTGSTSREPVTLDADCPVCDAPVSLEYANQSVRIECTRCPGLIRNEDGSDGFILSTTIPPAVSEDRSAESILEATLVHFLQKIRSLHHDVCPTCTGVVDSSVTVCQSHEATEDDACPNCDQLYRSEGAYVCTRCKTAAHGPAPFFMLVEPSVTAFYAARGTEHRDSSWEAFARAGSFEEDIVETGPGCLQITVQHDHETLSLTLDETLNVIDRDR